VFDHLAANELQQHQHAHKNLFLAGICSPVCTALSKALQLLGAVEPQALLQQVRLLQCCSWPL
jgi:hypothetical protein